MRGKETTERCRHIRDRSRGRTFTCFVFSSITRPDRRTRWKNTTGIPLLTPRGRNRFRTAFARAQLIVLEISAIRTKDGSTLAPAPMEDTMGILWIYAWYIRYTLGLRESMASTTKSRGADKSTSSVRSSRRNSFRTVSCNWGLISSKTLGHDLGFRHP